jgi:hypothetical protein
VLGPRADIPVLAIGVVKELECNRSRGREVEEEKQNISIHFCQTNDTCGQVQTFSYTAVPWRNLLQGIGCPLIDVTLIIDEIAPI